MEKENQSEPRTSCIRCGSCCRKGGPVLHRQDLEVIRAGHASHRNLVTIRKGEPAFHPAIGKVLSAEQELVRVGGQTKSWTCHFYEAGEDQGVCTIYEHRFAECRALKCWDPEELLGIIGEDTIGRADLLNPNDPLLEIIAVHERECPYAEVERIAAHVRENGDSSSDLTRLTDIVRRDLAVRLYATHELGLDLTLELFALGRPIFKSLVARGFEVREDEGEIRVEWKPTQPPSEV